ncbi:bifunctional nicotinamide-nucleotide adenylyltransferase/Nudix hydroxylase [Pseudomonas bohemica]|uniref:bifunctional nicotinamide-nucleotide adenylyltransferase/Nudix hydroxylase n=1 Tax=Pseudomonas bohemica TaxID=2044872 RepID=UPI000DA63CA5|nr:bifunctional nicotinamide-nucleotide adenylyltransferase/Nudix hydroxylase [Pseudomonas bohemica]
MNNFDIAVVIGRFQPFHRGHATLLKLALERAARVVVVLGSAHRARDAKNPFTWEERAAMIDLSLHEMDRERVSYLPVRDLYDDRRWQATVSQGISQRLTDKAVRVALVGFNKDASSYYLGLFPSWEFIAAPREHEIDASDLRRVMFEGEDVDATDALLAGLTHPKVHHYLRGWLLQSFVAGLRAEHISIARYKRAWKSAPYEPIFVTVDAVVKVGKHVLLVQRKGEMGKGLWALPGGFLEPRERLLQSAIRELREETGLGILSVTLEGAFKDTMVFDHPDRSQRGRTITHAHFFDLGSARLPEVCGADDATLAQWILIESIPSMEEQMFEDHYMVLARFLNL